MLCHFLTVLSLQKKRDFWRSVSAWNLALGFLYVRKWRMVHFWRKNSNPISIFEYFRRFSWNKFAIFFFNVKNDISTFKKWVFDDEPLKKPLKTVLMLDYVHYQWRQNLSVRLLLSAMILAREPPIITLDKKMGPSTYLLHSTFPHSMHKKRFE